MAKLLLFFFFFSEAILGLADALMRFVDIEPPFYGSPFVFEVLVLFEEVLDLILEVVIDTAHVGDIFEAWIFSRDSENLPVSAFFIFHVEDTNRSDFEDAAGEGGLADEDEHVEVVTIIGAGMRDEAVVGGVEHR